MLPLRAYGALFAGIAFLAFQSGKLFGCEVCVGEGFAFFALIALFALDALLTTWALRTHNGRDFGPCAISLFYS
jgi:hypothetical protein